VARIGKAEIARLNAEVAVQRLAESRGLELTEQPSGDLAGPCPWCGTAGALVIDAENAWACSSCAKAGGAVEWVMATEGVSLSLAVEMLREGLPLSDGPVGSVPKKASTSKLPPFDAGLPDEVLLGEVAAFYHRTLLEAPEAGEFLERRGLADAELVDAFRLGFSNRNLAYRIPNRQRAAGKKLRQQLQSLGVLASSGHEAFRGSLVVPVCDVDGRVVQLYGRKIGTHLVAGTQLHTWLHGPVPLFNAATMATNTEVVLVGSVLDALSLWSAGFRHVMAVAGGEGFDRSHLEAMQLAGVTRVLLGFRRGGDAADRVATALLRVGIECFAIGWPAGMDANDYALASANPTDAFAKAIRSAAWMGKGPAPKRRRQAPVPKAPAGASEERAADEPVPAATEAEPALAGPGVVEDLGVEHDVDEDHAVNEDEDEEGDEEGEPLLASPVPPAPADVAGEWDGEALRLTFGERHWRVRNLEKCTSFDSLRLNVCVSVPASPRGPGFHVDVFDLLSARARAGFVRDAAAEIHVEAKVLKDDLAKVFGAADAFVEAAIRRAQEPEDPRVELDEDERATAMELLTDRHLIERISADFARAGMVGETTNCLIGYLAAVSRKLAQPLAVIVQSTSAAGKSALMEAVLDFVPAEERIKYSAMTGQSLYYLGEHDLAHKVLAIAEEEGAERASYALKLLQSEGELSIASTGKDTSTGRLTTHEYKVTGPASIFLTTTAIDVDEELLNRCIVLTVDEDQAQTRAIHDRQRRAHTLDGLVAGNERAAVLKQHQDAQRLLEPIAVVNPFADRLGFMDAATRTRRDHVKYLTLINAIALLHQHQRRRHGATTADGTTITYIEATLEDIELANTLAHEALGRSLDDLPPQTRRLLDALDAMVSAIAADRVIERDKVRFTRRDARERLGWGDTQLKIHLARLVDLELVWVHRTERAGAFVYELAWDASMGDKRRFLPGLVDVGALRNTASPTDEPTATTDDRSGPEATRSGLKLVRSGSGRPPVGPRSGGGRGTGNGSKSQANGHKPGPVNGNGAKRTVPATKAKPRRSGGDVATPAAAPAAGRARSNGAAR